MEPQAPLQRRHIYVIDKEFQYRFLSTWLVMTFGFILIILAVAIAGWNMLPKGGGASEVQKVELLGYLIQQNAWFIILLTFFLALYLLLLSHRVAGPAYRISRSIERMIAGDYDFAVILRKKDYMKDVAQGLNTLLKDLQERQQQVRLALEEATRVSAALKAGGPVTPELQASSAKVCETLNSLLKKREVGMDSQIQSMAEGSGSSAPAGA